MFRVESVTCWNAALLPRALSVTLHPDLVEHLMRKPVRMPSRSKIYDFRLLVDCCTMRWAREFVFPSEGQEWHTHFRVDSSPQYCKNYLVAEIDKMCFSHVSSREIDSVLPRCIPALF